MLGKSSHLRTAIGDPADDVASNGVLLLVARVRARRFQSSASNFRDSAVMAFARLRVQLDAMIAGIFLVVGRCGGPRGIVHGAGDYTSIVDMCEASGVQGLPR